ncbi:hypothetical protein [Neobacillus mesonae]|uniref:hypothetical protein n=1 Tax=Neobacillus mesonae TaxID=1193713 RepID=UPI002E2365A8|nr:hypothetical protein [Neobacillus mesonae]
MKKNIPSLLVIIAVFLIFATIKPESAVASSYVDKEFAALAKKGKLKGVYGNVGMTYKTLKKKQKGTVGQAESYIFYSTKKAGYGFFYGKSFTKISPGQKVVIIGKDVQAKISPKQLKKYFGKPVEQNTYKAGKYYIHYITYGKGKVTVYIGTKAALNAYYTDGTYYIK